MPHDCFYLDATLTCGDSVFLDGEEHRHLQQVMRHQAGDQVMLINGRGSSYQATITAIDRKQATLRVDHEAATPPLRRPLILLQGMVRPAPLDFIAEKGTELGITDFLLFCGERSQQKQWSMNQQLRFKKILIAALKQSGNRFLPTVHFSMSLSDALENLKKMHVAPQLFFGDPTATLPLREAPLPTTPSRGVAVCIGPESGLSPKECLLLKKAEAIGVSLHRHILRAETAAIVAAATLQ